MVSPSSAARRSGRKALPTTQQLNNSEPVAPSPSRPAKRRRTTAAQQPIQTEASSSDEEDTSPMTEAADTFVPFLKEADYKPMVAYEHPNNEENNQSVSAYAKISGKTWTYYVKDSSIIIGRSQGDTNRGLGADSLLGDQQALKPAHIDLGPSKLVSRNHATIFYETEREKWLVRVNGRNPIKINSKLDLRRGQGDTVLSSGDVLEIQGTEMIFVLADVTAVIAPHFLARVRGDPDDLEPAVPWTVPGIHGHPPSLSAYVADQQAAPYLQPSLAPEPVYRPSTPVTSHLNAPYLTQAITVGSPAAFVPGIVMDSNEHIDYASDAFKDIKPPCSYATLISQAILSSERKKLSLSHIYEWIQSRFSYYRHLEEGWKNSIRHNLSLNPHFTKIPRESHEPGKGGLWMIDPEREDHYRAEGMKISGRGGARRASGPSSPAPKRNSPNKITPPQDGSGRGQAAQPSVPGQHHTTSSNLGIGPVMHTPSRNTHGPELVNTNGPYDNPPLPGNAFLANNAGEGSPQTLSSSYMNDEAHGFSNVYTPAPQRREPRITVPSTAKLPSQYLPQSSPAPFWKSVNNIGSTPAAFPDTSPLKANGPSITPNLQSSSPPPQFANGSPTRARASVIEPHAEGASGLGARDGNAGEERNPIDLMRQFPKIGDRLVSNTAR